MVLQFQPPPDWLIQNYLNRPNTVQQGTAILGGLNDIATNYITRKDEEKKQALAQQAKDIEMAKGLAGSGQDFMDAYKQIVAARTSPKTTLGTSLIDRAKAFFGGQPKPTSSPLVPSSSMPPQMSTATVSGMQSIPPPSMSPQPSSPPMPTPSPASSVPVGAGLVNPDGTINEGARTAYIKQHGSAGWDRYMKSVQEQQVLKTAYGKEQLVPVMTKKAALAKGSVSPNTKIVEPPNQLDIGTKQDQFDQKEWDKIVKETNPLTASSRSTLGMASKANFQADRALVTLSKPVVTNQEAGNVMADIAAIYQTGSPTQYGMSHQEYSTLYGKIQGALQTITGKPQDSLPDAIKQRLVGVLHDMKGTNGTVLKQQLDFTEKAKKRIISKFPQEWQDIRATLENNQTPLGQPTIPGTGPHGASVSQNGHIYNWNPKTGQYE